MPRVTSGILPLAVTQSVTLLARGSGIVTGVFELDVGAYAGTGAVGELADVGEATGVGGVGEDGELRDFVAAGAADAT
jgi:hypothetical protein